MPFHRTLGLAVLLHRDLEVEGDGGSRTGFHRAVAAFGLGLVVFVGACVLINLAFQALLHIAHGFLIA